MAARIIISLLFLHIAVCLWGQSDRIDRLITEADELSQNEDLRTADQLPYWLQAYNESLKTENKYKIGLIAMTLGDIFNENELYNQALFYYKTILPVFTENESKGDDEILLIRKIGQTYSGLGKPDSAYYFYAQIIDEFEYPERIDILRDIVEIYISNKSYDKALEYNLKIRDLLIEHQANKKELSKIYNNLGYNYNFLNNYPEAITHFDHALKLTSIDSEDDKISVLINLGIAHFNSGDNEKCIAYLQEADQLNGKLSHNGEIDQLLATAHIKKSDYFNALKKARQTEEKCKSSENMDLLSDVYYSYAQIYARLLEYDHALEYFQKHFDLRDSLDLIIRQGQQELLQYQRQLENTEKEVEIELKTKELKISQLISDNAQKAAELYKVNLENTKKDNEIVLLLRDQRISEAELENKKLEQLKKEQDFILIKQKLDAELGDQLIKDLKQQEEIQRLTNEKQEAEIKSQNVELEKEKSAKEVLQKDNAISELEIKRRKTSQRNLGIGAGLLAALLLALYFIYRNKNKAHGKLTLAYDSLEEAQVQLKAAESRITGLLKQQVSGAVAQALISNVDASKVERRFVCIMFLDIRNFTGYAEVRKPEEIIAFQNSVFGFMIDIIEKRHGVVNQLLGDGFMATFGAPESSGNDTQNAFLAAKEIISTLADKVQKQEVESIKVGVGLHAGYVVTGNVGNDERKQYSITGNTVILAARLEQLNKEYGSSLVISKEVYDQLPPQDQEPIEFKEVMVKGRSTPIAVSAFH